MADATPQTKTSHPGTARSDTAPGAAPGSASSSAALPPPVAPPASSAARVFGPLTDWQGRFLALRDEIDRMFGRMDWPDLRLPFAEHDPMRGWLAAPPAMDLVERDGEYELQAELPGLTLDDIDVRLADGMLTVKGEKTSQRKEDDAGYHLRERSFGAFHRALRLPAGIEADKVAATFENGVLRITLPKSASARANSRKIEVKAV